MEGQASARKAYTYNLLMMTALIHTASWSNNNKDILKELLYKMIPEDTATTK